MNIEETIKKINKLDENATIYAQKINNKFIPESEVTIVKILEEEAEWPTNKISEKYCKEKYYFLEIYLIKEIIEDYSDAILNDSEIVKKIIYYAENDAYC